MQYSIGRGANGRANLMHALVEGTTNRTLCGKQLTGSRAYMKKAIREVLCYRCAKKLPVGKVISIQTRLKYA